MKSKVFVTGASGLLGSHILVEFTQKFDMVYALYRSEKGKNIAQHLFSYYGKASFFEKVVWVRGDLNDLNLIQKVVSDVDLVVHAAALVSFEKRDKSQLYKINIEGTKNVLKAIKHSNVTDLVFVSSVASIRNKNVEGFFVEDGVVLGGRTWSDYARTKTEAESLVLEARKKGLNTIIINPGVILGPGDINNSSTAIFKTVKNGLKFYTSGINGVVDVRDVVMAITLLLKKKETHNRYVCVSRNIPFKDLFSLMASYFNVNPPTIKAFPLLLTLACKVELVSAFFRNDKPRITKENTAAAFSEMKFSSQQLIKDTDIEFNSLESTVENAINFFNYLEFN